MQKTPENGRSMVEMLGTLAIIGVLSVGGIVGFNTAMDKYRTNNIWDFLHKTTALTHSIALTHPLSAENVQDVINELNSSYLATAVMCSYGYAVEMSGLPKGVCKLIASQANEDFYVEEAELYLGSDCTPGPIDCNSDDNNAISFIFDMTTNTDGTAEDAFYYCESNAIKIEGEKVALCQCSDSDVEIQYNSPQDAIDELCQETSYSCSYSGNYIQRNGDVIANCACTTEGSFKTDEEAIMAMCAPYECDGPKTIYQGNRFVNWAEKCECESSKGGHYLSDEEAIAAMCQNTLRHYSCSSGGFIYNRETNNTTFFTCFCGTSNWDSYYNSDEEAIANMCNPEISNPEISISEVNEYYCSGNFSGLYGPNGQVTTCICTYNSPQYYGSDEEAIAAMCQNTPKHYTCSAGGFIYGLDSNNEDFHYLCFCSNDNYDSYYASDEDAIAQMCTSTDYFCSTNGVYRDAWGHDYSVFYGTCDCATTSAAFNSDQEAIAAMCQNFYKCDGPSTIFQGTRYVMHNADCDCNSSKNGAYDSDEEAIAAMCQNFYKCSGPCSVMQGSRRVADNCYDGNGYCICNTANNGFYDSDEAAIEAMCPTQTVTQTQTITPAPGMYICSGFDGNSAGSDFIIKNNSTNLINCKCDTNKTGYYDSDEDAMRALCQGTHYYCPGGSVRRNYDSEEVTMCSCITVGAVGFYNSDEEAIANMCNPDPEISISEVAEYRCSAGGDHIYGPNGLVTTCYCTDNGTQYYGSDEEAIAAMCQGGYYKCEGPITLFHGSRYVIPCDCNSSKAGYYDSDEEAIAAMCRYKCDGPCTIEQGYRIVKDCYACNCNTSKEGHYDSDEEAIAAMCKD